MATPFQDLLERLKQAAEPFTRASSSPFLTRQSTTAPKLPAPQMSLLEKARNASAAASSTQPRGVVRTFVEEAPAKGASKLSQYLEQEEGVRDQLSLGENALRDMVIKPARILQFASVDMPRYLLGSISTVGKTMLEEIYAPVFGREETRAALTATDPNVLKAEEILFKNPTSTYQEMKEQIDAYTATAPEATEWEKKNLGLTLAVVGFASDAFPGKPSSTRLAKEVIEELVAADTKEAAEAILKNAGLPPELAVRASKRAAESRSAAEMRNIVQEESARLLSEISRGRNADEVVNPPTPEDALARARAAAAGEDLPGPRVSLEETPAPAARERVAKADLEKRVEKVEADTSKPRAVFRGGDEFDRTKATDLGIPVSPDRSIAERFVSVRRGGVGKVEELFIQPGAKIASEAKVPKEIRTALDGNNMDAERRLVAWARENGYDAVDLGKTTGIPEVRVVNPEVLKTKAEIGKKPAAVKSSYTPNPNLVRKIGKTEDKFELLGMIEKEFPRLPDRLKDRIVNKLSRIKRTADIEGYLRTAKRLESTALSPTQKRIWSKNASPAMKEVMDEAERIAYVKNISRKIEDQETAVVAEAEYNRLMEGVDQKTIDLYNDKSMELGFLEDVLANDEAGTLWRKYYRGKDPADPTMELQELRNAAMKKSKARRDYRRGLSSKKPKPLTLTEERLLDVDAEVEALGYADLDEAYEAIQRYAKMRTRVNELRKDVKDLAPTIQGAQIIRGVLDEIPVVGGAEIGTLEKLANTADVRSTYKDIAGLSGGFRDVYRNFQRFFGPRFDEAKKAILDPFDRAKGDFVDEYNKIADDLEVNVVEKYNIRRGSKDSGRIQTYGEAPDEAGKGEKGQLMTKAQLKDQMEKEIGVQRTAEIIEAAEWFRKTYDRLIDELNEVRAKMYPNNPEKLIAKRKDYFRHFQEIGDDFRSALGNFFDTPSGIDPKLVGISEQTKPKSKFLPFAESRKGTETEIDAVGGMVDYIPMFAYAKHIDPQIANFRYLRRKLSEVAPTRGAEVPLLDEITGTPLPGGQTIKHKGIENFLTFLDRFSNDLAGKTNVIDRYLQERVPGGRATMRAIDWLNNRMKANAILGNLGSAMAQVANVPLGIASAKQYALPGMGRTLANTLNWEGPITKSTFLKERYLESLKDRFPFQVSDRPIQASVDAGRRKLAWILQAVDRVGTTFIWNSHYAKGVAEGVEDAVKYADDQTRRLVAGRGIGEVPLDQKGRSFQVVAPFQLEVANFWHVMDDMTRRYYKGAGNRDLAGIALLLVANYLFNEAAENTRGSRVVYDPINALLDGWDVIEKESAAGDTGTGIAKATGRQVGELLSNLPLGQSAAAMFFAPETRQALFGQQDPTRFGATPLLPQTVSNLTQGLYELGTATGDPAASFQKAAKNALSFVLPYGAKQIDKMYGGLEAMLTGTAEDTQGRFAFNVQPTILNWARAIAFGKNATSDAREYFEQREDLFYRLDRQETDRKRETLEAERVWSKASAMIARGDKQAAAEFLNKQTAENPDLAKRVKEIIKDEKMGLDGKDRLVKMLGVENGERAKFIVEQLNGLEDKEAKAEYLNDLVEKRIITKQVKAQIKELLKAQKEGKENE